jgi:uncharacterized protein
VPGSDLPDAAIKIAGHEIKPGERRRVEIPIAEPYGQAQISIPAIVVHGREPGPRLFVSAAIHGDELNGVEIIRRLLKLGALRTLSGVLIAVPVVNVYGFIAQSRYLPDRRDLNRSFPGSPRGSVAARLAHVFMSEIVAPCSHGIDLHTGSQHRVNLPQIRAHIDDPETERLARAFGVPVILNADLRDGSLREAVHERGMPMLLYEGGEALRFDEVAIRAGVRGVLCVMRAIGMLSSASGRGRYDEPLVARQSSWVRAPESGVLRGRIPLGAAVEEGQVLGVIADPAGDDEIEIVARQNGILISKTDLPLVNAGDALFHIAEYPRSGASRSALRSREPEPMEDDEDDFEHL